MRLSKEELLEKALSLVSRSPMHVSSEFGIVYRFSLDPERIRFFLNYLPKWKNGVRYYLISEIRFGARDKIGLYLSEESGELCVF